MAKPEYFARSQKGSSGPDVALIQTWLGGVQKVYPCVKPVGVDGKFGGRTVTAVKRFQCMSDLSVDGVVGKSTWDALYDTYAAAVSPGEQYPGIPLREGDRGAAVKSAQCRLLARGFSLTADGDMGPGTVAAVREFQKAAGLSADGVVGKMTWTVLYTG